MGRIIVFTGKGGVGKTSIAAAHALQSARTGKKTILVSVDMAHNIGDIFRAPVGKDITKIEENLWAVELDPYALMREDFPEAQKSVFDLIGGTKKNLDAIGSHFIIPGFENLFSLLKIKQLYDDNTYDRIIVDCAPTGETLSLLKLPELLSWYMEKFFPVGKTMLRVLSPVSRVKYHVTLPSRKTLDKIEVLHAKLLELQNLLKDKDISTVRLVCMPEKMIVEETKRNFMYMNLYGYQVDTVFINRMVPEDIKNPFMQKIKEHRSRYIRDMESVFTDIPIIYVPWYPDEIRGFQAIQKLSEEVLNIPDLFAVRAHTESESYEKWEEGYILTITLPNNCRGETEVFCHTADISIKVNNFNRCIPLPNTLRGSEIVQTDVNDRTVRIYFRLSENKEA